MNSVGRRKKEGTKTEWRGYGLGELLAFLQNQVPSGAVTTYGNLSRVFYGGTHSAPAIVAMLNGAVNAQPDNRIWTNRVVNSRGEIKVAGQLEQLQREGISIGNNGHVDFNLSPALSFDAQTPDPDPATPTPTPPIPRSGDLTAFSVFQLLLDQQGYEVGAELLVILKSNNYEKASFANLIANQVQRRLATFLNHRDGDLFTLIQLAGNNSLLKDDAIDLAHTCP